MSKINYMTGELHGKLGGVVGSRHNGTYYTKIYTPPSNPNTPKQQELRACFKHITHIASLLAAVLEEYTRPKLGKQTPINHLLHLNKPMLGKQGQKWDASELNIMEGMGHLNPITQAMKAADNKSVTLSWIKAGEDTDIAIGVVFDEGLGFVYTKTDTRDKQQLVIPIDRVEPQSRFHAYLMFARLDGDHGENSNTGYLLVT